MDKAKVNNEPKIKYFLEFLKNRIAGKKKIVMKIKLYEKKPRILINCKLSTL